MNRFVAAVFVALTLGLCTETYADPDRTLVQIILDDDSAVVTVSGRSRLDVVAAVIRSLKESKRQCLTITVGPWLQLPDHERKNSKLPSVTVCVDDHIEGTETTAYLAISKEMPIETLIDLAEALKSCGLNDVRLLSEQTLHEYLNVDG